MENNCGIYTIKINNKYYVGSSKNLKNRFRTHKSNLKHNRHENKKLQYAFNKYLNAEFEVLDTCDETLLTSLEKYWMNILNVLEEGYNLATMPGNYYISKKVSKETKGKISLFFKNRKQTEDHIRCRMEPLKKKIKQYTLEGEFIREWNGIKEAAVYINGCPSEIVKVCKKKTKSCKNFIWTYKDDELILEDYKKNKAYKKVYLFDNDKFIKYFNFKILI